MIVRHPVSVCVPVNHRVTLSVCVESTGILKYQWFTKDNGVTDEVGDTKAFWMIGFVLLISAHNFLVSFTHRKVAGGTEADLSIRARQTQLYVCRVNDQLGNYVFSDWVKVKVLDIDKTGLHCYVNVVYELHIIIIIVKECVLCFCQS